MDNTVIRPRFGIFTANLFVDGMTKIKAGEEPSNLELQAIDEVYLKFMELVMNALTREALEKVRITTSVEPLSKEGGS